METFTRYVDVWLEYEDDTHSWKWMLDEFLVTILYILFPKKYNHVPVAVSAGSS